jgi:hypothetical protein
MMNDPREAIQDAAAAAAEDMQDFRDAANAELPIMSVLTPAPAPACPVCGGDEMVNNGCDCDVCPDCEFVHCECDDFINDEGFTPDGQPTEYEEYQDLYGGDDWDQGQYDDYDY